MDVSACTCTTSVAAFVDGRVRRSHVWAGVSNGELSFKALVSFPLDTDAGGLQEVLSHLGPFGGCMLFPAAAAAVRAPAGRAGGPFLLSLASTFG